MSADKRRKAFVFFDFKITCCYSFCGGGDVQKSRLGRHRGGDPHPCDDSACTCSAPSEPQRVAEPLRGVKMVGETCPRPGLRTGARFFFYIRLPIIFFPISLNLLCPSIIPFLLWIRNRSLPGAVLVYSIVSNLRDCKRSITSL